MVIKNKKNWITLGRKKEMFVEKGRNSFMIRKLKCLFSRWNIIFFRLSNLKKNKLNISKINLYKNSYLYFYKNMRQMNIIFNHSNLLWEDNMNFVAINYNGYYLNCNILSKWKFSKVILEKVYINLFFKLICGLIIKFLFILLLKIMVIIKYNFINLKKNV